MEWLWIPAVALVSVFILVLCWAFFKDYTCCPCRRRRPSVDEGEIPPVDTCSSISIDIDAVPPTQPKPSQFHHPYVPPVNTCPSFSIDIDDVLATQPRLSQFHRPYIQPPQPPPRPYSHRVPLTHSFPYNFGVTADENSLVQIRNGIPTLDLHGLKVREAKYVTKTFLQQSEGCFHHVRIITGRGLHSVGGVPRIKPEVESMLDDYSYRVTGLGGCYEVDL